MDKNYFTELNKINVQDKVEKKNGLSYLSWAWAWGEIKKRHPEANYKIYERDTEYGLVNYFTDGRTCWVKTGAIVNDIEIIEMLPVMDFKNRSIPYESVTSYDVNKTIQRSLTKAFARHGLGLYIFAGEDLPEEEAKAKVTPEQIEKIKELVAEKSIPNLLTYYKIEKLEDLPETDAKELIARKTKKKNEDAK